jgi:hypothetical protein
MQESTALTENREWQRAQKSGEPKVGSAVVACGELGARRVETS